MQVTLKLATSLDGRIALANGQSQWLTGPLARQQGHRLRAAHQAIIVGSGTVLADDPLLTVRLDDHCGPQPLRVIADRRLRIPADCQLLRSRDQGPVLIASSQAGHYGGVEVIAAPAPQDVCVALAQRGIDRLMIEGGGTLAAAFVCAGLVSALEWFRAPVLLGGDARPALANLGLTDLSAVTRWQRVDVQTLGDDLWERYRCTPLENV